MLRAKLRATPGETRQALLLVDEASAITVKPRGEVHGICRDPDDDHVLECLLTSGADYLVTGDDDLLTLGEFHESPILTLRKFELLFPD